MDAAPTTAQSTRVNIEGAFGLLGRSAIMFFEHLGAYSLLLWWSCKNIRNAWESRRNVVSQMTQIGVDSVPIVIFVATFVGMVTSVQSSYQLYAWIPRTVVGSLVIKSVLLELTPLVTALVLAGKVGATIAAELGSMRVTDQIDALEAMGYDSISFLVTPRVFAGVAMFPVLMVFGDLLAILGGLFGAVVIAHISAPVFIAGLRSSFAIGDAVFGLVKAMVFGYTITSIACYQGYYVRGGSAGIGTSTMRTVIWTSLAVVVLDFLLASILL